MMVQRYELIREKPKKRKKCCQLADKIVPLSSICNKCKEHARDLACGNWTQTIIIFREI
jgi:thymidine kinase